MSLEYLNQAEFVAKIDKLDSKFLPDNPEKPFSSRSFYKFIKDVLALAAMGNPHIRSSHMFSLSTQDCSIFFLKSKRKNSEHQGEIEKTRSLVIQKGQEVENYSVTHRNGSSDFQVGSPEGNLFEVAQSTWYRVRNSIIKSSSYAEYFLN